MHNELSEADIKMLQEEIDYKLKVLRPKCVEDLKTARGFGDLSENYEYKAAKQELRRCDSRIRYLRRMIDTAKVIRTDSEPDRVGVFDQVEIFYEDEGETETLTITTTVREDAIHGVISKESPLGRAIFGRREGDRVHVKVNDDVSYDVQIRKLIKGAGK